MYSFAISISASFTQRTLLVNPICVCRAYNMLLPSAVPLSGNDFRPELPYRREQIKREEKIR